MRRNHIDRILFVILAAAAVIASVYFGYLRKEQEVEPDTSLMNRSLRCAIQFDRPSRHLPGLSFGYNYELIKRFAADNGDTLQPVVNARAGHSWLDSLKLGLVDIVVLPYVDSMSADSVRFSVPVDSLTVWAVREDRVKGLQEIDDWISGYMESEGHDDLRDLFLLRYSPSRRAEWGRTVRAISPYDSLVRAGAKTLGWDWRLLCAVIFHESQFHIELRSPRGAAGLMQMMPATAARMGVEDLLDPEESLRAGVTYLKRLEDMFRSRAADNDELCKFTLAAYNAGEGRLLDVINYAEAIGADSKTWEGLLSVIPHMRDEATFQVDSVIKLGTFQGTETIYYIERVFSLFEDFKKIKP